MREWGDEVTVGRGGRVGLKSAKALEEAHLPEKGEYWKHATI